MRVEHAPGMPGTFSCHWLQREPIVSNPGMHHGTCVTHFPWYMSGSLTRGGGGENVPGIPGASAIRNFTCLVRCPWNLNRRKAILLLHIHYFQSREFKSSLILIPITQTRIQWCKTYTDGEDCTAFACVRSYVCVCVYNVTIRLPSAHSYYKSLWHWSACSDTVCNVFTFTNNVFCSLCPTVPTDVT